MYKVVKIVDNTQKDVINGFYTYKEAKERIEKLKSLGLQNIDNYKIKRG